ncbi:MAG: CrcB family protein [Acidimicrobiales bacterium]|jgi:CrcB protein
MTESTDSQPELPLDPDAGPSSDAHRPAVPHVQPYLLCLVAVGGATGTAARYGVSLTLPSVTGHWPTGTFVVNMAGALVLGALLEGLARRGPDIGRRQEARLLVGVGFCGALTTFSTLAVEADLLVRSNDGGLALAYAVGSVVGGLVATAIGITAAAGHHRVRARRVVP